MSVQSRPAQSAHDRVDPAPPLHVSVVCSGNICRSPIGEQVVRRAVAQAGLADRVRVTSAAIGSWHIGAPAQPGAQRALQGAGYPTDHRAHQITRDELTTVDLALTCDRGHLRALTAMTDDPAKVVLLRSLDPTAADSDVPDPYQLPDEDFVEVLEMIEAAVPGILDEIRRRL